MLWSPEGTLRAPANESVGSSNDNARRVASPPSLSDNSHHHPLQGHLDAFASWERMSTDFSQFLRAVYKEFVPEKSAAEVGAILERFKGREAGLLKKVREKYADKRRGRQHDGERGGQEALFEATVQ